MVMGREPTWGAEHTLQHTDGAPGTYGTLVDPNKSYNKQLKIKIEKLKRKKKRITWLATEFTVEPVT